MALKKFATFLVSGRGVKKQNTGRFRHRCFSLRSRRGALWPLAAQLGRATSAVNYAIANLEEQLGVQLFDRDQVRRPTLTEAGTIVLAKARSVSIRVDNLRGKGQMAA